jgi:hypothetical protein
MNEQELQNDQEDYLGRWKQLKKGQKKKIKISISEDLIGTVEIDGKIEEIGGNNVTIKGKVCFTFLQPLRDVTVWNEDR